MNIFYNPSYWKTKKVILTKKFKYSIFYNLLIDFLYILNVNLPENIIYSGPQRRANNLLKTFKNDQNVFFNKIISHNNYILQFDNYGQRILQNLTKLDNQKIIVGPLYNTDQVLQLMKISKEKQNIKISVASESAKNTLLSRDEFELDESKIVITPIGVSSKSEIEESVKYNQNKKNCLIFYKKRDVEDLNKVKDFLNSRNYSFTVLTYGNYKKKDLINLARKSKFGIIIDKTESQGIGIQELMCCNLPLYVWDYTKAEFEGFEFNGTSVPYWSNECGLKVENYHEFEKNFDDFIMNLKNYNPANYAKNVLSFEACGDKLKDSFLNW